MRRRTHVTHGRIPAHLAEYRDTDDWPGDNDCQRYLSWLQARDEWGDQHWPGGSALLPGQGEAWANIPDEPWNPYQDGAW
ncbi:hypothetical protein [Rhodococcus sp. AH-ZY2]|uniref:hypothetical protein n=1 Tax=Rhodococcus sp. AH-ZY2 TaxID=3047468 RepID=UPI0027DF0896|nr:hypothetical protein [Rhodococcus sp. AH-ZY2]WML61917.1 hypothetical protein QNA09_18955 [Rhodococcus sp. AH-ZY2]